MGLISKHKIKPNLGQIELQLFLNKKQLREVADDQLPKTIKREAELYVQNKLKNVPIRIIRVMIGSFLYCSFVVPKE